MHNIKEAQSQILHYLNQQIQTSQDIADNQYIFQKHEKTQRNNVKIIKTFDFSEIKFADCTRNLDRSYLRYCFKKRVIFSWIWANSSTRGR